MLTRLLFAAALAAAFTAPRPAAADDDDDDVKDIPSEDLRVGKDGQKRYFLVGPRKGAEVPKAGWGLVVVLPGGPGTADFHPFVKRIYQNAIPDGYIVAQPVAVKFTDGQEVVWPTAADQDAVEDLKFTTEAFVDGVIAEVAARHRLDPKRVFTLSWSSGGPAAYAVSLTSKRVTGSLVAMSVYKPDRLPDRAAAKGHAYYLYHSPDDRVCPYRMAERAAKDLAAAGAAVELAAYEGGHGWRGPLYDDIRAGLGWLEKKAGEPRK